MVDAKGQRYSFGVNALGWWEWERDPRGGTTYYAYDAAGNLTSLTNRRGQQVTFTYDALGSLESRTADGATTTYRTDPIGRFTATANGESIDTLYFDAAGRQTDEVSWRGGVRYVLKSAYDAQGRRRQLAIGGWTVGYHYDAMGQLDTIIDVSGRRTYYGHNQRGDVASAVFPVGQFATYARTGGVLSAIIYSGSAESAIGVRYALDHMGRDSIAYKSDLASGRDYAYDDAGRLSGFTDWALVWPQPCNNVDRGGYCPPQDPTRTVQRTASYDYDKVGNRLDSGASLDGNRLTHFGPYTLQYDADGNVVYKFRDGCPSGQECHDEYVWNSLGQLVRAWKYDQGYVWYGYDGWGRRISTRYEYGRPAQHAVYDGDDLVMQAEPNGHVTHVYAYAPGVDHPHSLLTNARMYYYQQDGAGNVTGLIDQDNALAATYQYGPFGQLLATTGGVSHSLFYKGREFEPLNGLYYMRARWYDPELGRFLSEDPSGLQGGMNPYEFAASNPVANADPSGLRTVADEHDCAFGLYGCAAGGRVSIAGTDVFGRPWGTATNEAKLAHEVALIRTGRGAALIGSIPEGPLPFRLVYSPDMLALKTDPYHNFPMSLDPDVIEGGTQGPGNNPGMVMWRAFGVHIAKLQTIPGSKLIAGTFEVGGYFRERGAVLYVTHRLFRPEFTVPWPW